MPLLDDRFNGVQASAAIKVPVRCATTANITLSGEQTIDGVAVSANGSGVAPDRVLVKDQTNSVNNGIYDVSTSAWTRSKDFDGARDVVQGTLIPVYAGTVNGRTTWQCTTANPVRPGTSSLTFEVIVDVDLAADLADATNPSLGAALVGRAVARDAVTNDVTLLTSKFGLGVTPSYLLHLQDFTLTDATMAGFYARGTTSIVMSDAVLELSGVTSTADSGATRAVVKHLGASYGYTASSASALIRASEHHAIRGVGTTGGIWGMEIGVHSEVAGDGATTNLGIYLASSHAGWITGTPVRNDTALLITGEDGWHHAIRYYDTNGATVLFDVDETGEMYSRTAQIGATGVNGTVIDVSFDSNNGSTIHANRSDSSGARYLGFGTDYVVRAWLETDGFKFGAQQATPVTSRSNGLTIGVNAALGVLEARTATAWKIGRSDTSGTHITFSSDNGSSTVTGGNIATNGSTTAYNTTSDARVKTAITSAAYDPDWIRQIQIREFEFIAEPGKKVVGVIAQELAEVEPSAVTQGTGSPGDDDFAPHGVDLAKLVPKLIREVQELRVRIEALGG